MNTVDIFSAGLGLTEPWFVSDVQLIPSKESHELELHITVDFKHGAKENTPTLRCCLKLWCLNTPSI